MNTTILSVKFRKLVILIYTILINENNELVSNSTKMRIMQKSNLANELRFITNPMYKNHDISKATATLEYFLPISHRYRTLNLIPSEELYNGMLEYRVPFDTKLTSEYGELEVQVTFTYVIRNEKGEFEPFVRKTSPTTITITPIAAWSDFIPDDALTSLDQRLLKIDAMIQDLNEFNDNLDKTKADNISIEKNIIQLTSHGEKIGDGHLLPSGGGGSVDESGVPIVEFNIDTPSSENEYEVVEF